MICFLLSNGNAPSARVIVSHEYGYGKQVHLQHNVFLEG
jgi:hypothetical protein